MAINHILIKIKTTNISLQAAELDSSPPADPVTTSTNDVSRNDDTVVEHTSPDVREESEGQSVADSGRMGTDQPGAVENEAADS